MDAQFEGQSVYVEGADKMDTCADTGGDASLLRDVSDPDTPRPKSRSTTEKPAIKIDVSLETLSPPSTKVDTPRPKSDPPIFGVESRQKSKEAAGTTGSASPSRLASVSDEQEEASYDIPAQPTFVVETPSKFDKMDTFKSPLESDVNGSINGKVKFQDEVSSSSPAEDPSTVSSSSPTEDPSSVTCLSPTEDPSLVERYLDGPESALCFAFIMSAHVYLGLFCLSRWFFWNDNGFVVIPLFLLSIGATLDNYRLYRGIIMGEAGLETWLTTLTYLVEFSALPLLFNTLAEIFSVQTGWWLVPIPVRVLSVTMCVANFNAFMSGVQGQYETVHQAGVWRHTIDPFKVPFQIMIGPVWVAVIGLFLGFLSLCLYGDSSSFLIQVVAFFGQALATKEPRSGQYVTNILEFVYMSNVLYMYMIHV